MTEECFREDLIKFVAANRLKTIREIAPPAPFDYAGLEDEKMYRLPDSVQLGLFMQKVDLNRYGPLPYKAYRSLLAEYSTIQSFVCNTYAQLPQDEEEEQKEGASHQDEDTTPFGHEHPTLKPTDFVVWDGRMGIVPSSIIKNGTWQINVDRDGEVNTMGGNPQDRSYVSPFSTKAYLAELGKGHGGK